MLIIAGTVQIRPDARDAAVQAGIKMQELTRAEDGCIEYGFSVPIDEPNKVLIFEVWRDQAANDGHAASAHLAEFITTIADIVDGPVELTKYEVSSSHPL
jgi:quinol monooxygenase YgiN